MQNAKEILAPREFFDSNFLFYLDVQDDRVFLCVHACGFRSLRSAFGNGSADGKRRVSDFDLLSSYFGRFGRRAGRLRASDEQCGGRRAGRRDQQG